MSSSAGMTFEYLDFAVDRRDGGVSRITSGSELVARVASGNEIADGSAATVPRRLEVAFGVPLPVVVLCEPLPVLLLLLLLNHEPPLRLGRSSSSSCHERSIDDGSVALRDTFESVSNKHHAINHAISIALKEHTA
jgi:hypothetical protein